MIGFCRICNRWFRALARDEALAYSLAVHEGTAQGRKFCIGSGARLDIESLTVPAPYFDARRLKESP